MTAYASTAVWSIALLVTGGILFRPWRVQEAVWAVAGAILLVALGMLSPIDAFNGAGAGTDVYLFLIGMMVLSEIARREGLFDWLAVLAVNHAHGSGHRLFLLVYAVGTVVTVFLSNDATAVVLTPAVFAAARAADAEPLPYLYICAFIANAASFVLPISNPANLVVFGDHMPSLMNWLALFALPSIAAIGLTYATLAILMRRAINQPVRTEIDAVGLSRGGLIAAIGIAGTAMVLTTASALGADLGLPTLITGVLTAAVVIAAERRSPVPVIRDISWSVLPLVAGLFVLVAALKQTGVVDQLSGLLQSFAAQSVHATAAGAGILVALACNIFNNLPAGLLAGSLTASASLPVEIKGAIMIGVDLGPNLSITGSLATLLWLVALRREGEAVSGWVFLKVGLIVMPPALIGALAALMIRIT